MYQPTLTEEAAEGKGADQFAEARAQCPGDRLVLFLDRRTGQRFFMAVPPSSPWYPLLPPEQLVTINPTT